MSEGTFTIPREEAENPNAGGGDTPFPEGHFKGVIEEVRVREIVRGDNADFLLQEKGEYFAESAEIASIQVGHAEGLLEGQDDPGARKLFDENIYLSFDGISWDDGAVAADNMNWRYEQSRRRLVNLALAVGAVEETADAVGPVPHFDSLLRETSGETGGGLHGSAIAFEVFHRKFKRRDGSAGVQEQIRRYDVSV